ncbi:hypothetical protein 162310526 [Organic Lake phycodnavirus]|nr:hypothetical protein 162310526 [Organic Lake phycodnavirus]
MYMDYEYIQDENHNDYIDRIIGLIQSNSQTNSMNLFIHKIIKQPEEYQILCNALYWFIKEPPIPIQQGGSDSPSLKRARTDSPEVPPAPEVLPAPAVAAVSEEATGAPPEVIAESGTSAEVAPTTKDYQDKIIKNLEQLKSKTFITIPYKNKLLIDQGFKQSNYKHYLSFYIINQQYI